MEKQPRECTEGPCPVETTLKVIGGKWKAMIIYHLLDEKKRFNKLKRMMPDITHRMLTLQLRELEKDNILTRTVFPEVPPRVEYELTVLGRSIEPIIMAIHRWGVAYQKNIGDAKNIKDAEDFIQV
ncbi:winged helix-turn-helix transcriptional regulator [Desulforamulus ruminis]|uniref:Helix-turn-helix HxlR type n=1 Tax=Desulforamulus ruminis (strain ATCC 23193 / DSM 2154 / NCIMB 8452 / DL) TaxID=696281 RepID=F6DR43_DESRL|nr:helix-turn-helix domain-containing protein [Desulforamulus ruminis]AEG59762.1 helix-turn-helix HxlR type [Desulforamulus ruminis DSM 2154]